MESDSKVCKYLKNGKAIAIGERIGKLFVMKFKVKTEEDIKKQDEVAQAHISSSSLNLWHQKLAHQNYQTVKQVLNSHDMKLQDKEETFCDACAMGKIPRLPFTSSENKTNRIGDIIHADVCVPLHVKSIGFLLLKDDFSHFRTTYFIAAKADVYTCFKDFLKKTDKHCEKGVKTIRTDNGLEFINEQVSSLLKEYGIQH